MIRLPQLLCLAFCLAALILAQDASSTADSASSAAPTATSNDSSPSGSATSTSFASSASSNAPAHLTSSTSFAKPSSVTRTNTTPTATSTIGPDENAGDVLPFQPRLSPALGVAGAILLITGLSYGFFGVRSRILTVSVSISYLVGLAILVLLCYVGSNQISDARQGAYLVAIVLPAVLVGGFACVFPATEFAATPVGGFCFAMWILCLAPGGAVHSQGGVVGLIVVMMIICSSTYFWVKTRQPGMIFSVAFTGATSFILGVDCFSRAGLKEFWIYVWDVNPDIFPLGTTTYPTTRRIKVESAGIVVAAFFGILSQIQLWKIIKKRHEEQERQRNLDLEQHERLETEVGRSLEQQNAHDKAQWEAMYNNRKPGRSEHSAGSINGSSYNGNYESSLKKYPSIKVSDVSETVVDSVEMRELRQEGRNSENRSSKRSSKRSSNTSGIIRVGSDDGVISSQAPQRHEETLKALAPVSETSTRTASPFEDPEDNSAQSAPSVTPLPFQVPDEAPLRPNTAASDAKSLTTVGSGPEFASTKQTQHQTSGDKASASPSVDLRDVPHIESDRASSVAATADPLTDEGDRDASQSSRPGSRSTQDEAIESPTVLRRIQSTETMRRLDINAGNDDGKIQRTEPKIKTQKSLPALDTLESTVNNKSDDALYVKPTELGDVLTLKTKPKDSASSISRSEGQSKGVVPVKQEYLPKDQPGPVSLYRTNEWAMHQTLADKPDFEEIAPPSEAGVGVSFGGDEIAAPVNVAALQRNVGNARQSPQLDKSTSSKKEKRSSTQARMSQSSMQPISIRHSASQPMPYSSPATQQVPISLARRPSRTPSDAASTASTIRPSQDLRVQSASVDDLRSSTALTNHNNGSTTLLSMREDMIRGRMSSASFANLPSTQSTTIPRRFSNPYIGMPATSQTSIPANDTSSRRNSSLPRHSDDNISLHELRTQLRSRSSTTIDTDTDDDEDMPLSQRRNLIRQQSNSSITSAPTIRRLSNPSFPPPPIRQSSFPNPNIYTDTALYDSHQPSRGPSTSAYERESRLATWRQTQAAAAFAASHNAQTQIAEDRRSAMLRAKEEAGIRRAVEQSHASARESVMDDSWRSPAMIDAHRDLLRKMQRVADNNAQQGR